MENLLVFTVIAILSEARALQSRGDKWEHKGRDKRRAGNEASSACFWLWWTGRELADGRADDDLGQRHRCVRLFLVIAHCFQRVVSCCTDYAIWEIGEWIECGVQRG